MSFLYKKKKKKKKNQDSHNLRLWSCKPIDSVKSYYLINETDVLPY